MAGVAGPMLRRDKPQGTRFLTGLLIGGLVSSLLLAAVLAGLGTLLKGAASPSVRQSLLVAALLVFGLLDLTDRTPHVWRQVPQALVRTLPPGRLGATWGFDLSLLFTTQKSTSLTWAALAGTLLLVPEGAWAVIAGMTVVSVLAITVRSVIFSLSAPSRRGDRSRPWHTHVRRVTGAGLLVLASVTAATALWGG